MTVAIRTTVFFNLRFDQCVPCLASNHLNLQTRLVGCLPYARHYISSLSHEILFIAPITKTLRLGEEVQSLLKVIQLVGWQNQDMKSSVSLEFEFRNIFTNIILFPLSYNVCVYFIDYIDMDIIFTFPQKSLWDSLQSLFCFWENGSMISVVRKQQRQNLNSN